MTLGSLGLPLSIVTIASQNVPGLAVLSTNGYQPPTGPTFVAIGLASSISGLFGGVPVKLAAITAALCAGPDSIPIRRSAGTPPSFMASATCWSRSAPVPRPRW